MTVNGTPLAAQMYIPETFFPKIKAEIKQRRMWLMSQIMSEVEPRKLLILIGKVKEFAPTSQSNQKLIVKQVVDYPFMLNKKLFNSMRNRFERELRMWEKNEADLIAIATFGVRATGFPFIEEIALMTVNNNWIPFETIQDSVLLGKLTTSNRCFTKGLRYNMAQTKPLACAVLTDTFPKETALYIVPMDASEDDVAEGNQLREESHLASWVWNTSESEMPALPEFVSIPRA